MSSTLITTLLWTTALGSGLMAGVYFAFSGFIMKAFKKIEPAQSVAAMNAINEVILNSVFMPVFLGSSLVSFVLVVISLVYWGEPGAGLILIAGATYFFGMFICTAVFNVPLNNLLAELRPDSENLQQVWSHYLGNWTKWNHLRAVSSLITCAICIWLLVNQ